MSILIINTGRDKEHSLPLGLVSLRWKQFKTDVEVLGENNGILLIWWGFMERFGLWNILEGHFYTLYMEVTGKSSSITAFGCFQVEAEIVFRVLIWGVLFQLSPNLVFSKEGAALLVQECGTMAMQHAEPSGEAGSQGCWWKGWGASGEAGSWEGWWGGWLLASLSVRRCRVRGRPAGVTAVKDKDPILISPLWFWLYYTYDWSFWNDLPMAWRSAF